MTYCIQKYEIGPISLTAIRTRLQARTQLIGKVVITVHLVRHPIALFLLH